jgi:acyl transferase domain-containing protein
LTFESKRRESISKEQASIPAGEDCNQGRGIAIIGMSGRFPGAGNVDEFWRNLAGGVDAIRRARPEDHSSTRLGPEVLRHPDYVGSVYYLDDVKLFDAEIFGFTAAEARITDPQHRIFMECVWEALESAGYLAKTSDLRIGLYAGSQPIPGAQPALVDGSNSSSDPVPAAADRQ